LQITKNVSINWSKKVPSDSRALNLLGLWGTHLKIQEEFTAGITSVTRRIRYYTLLAWYFQNLASSKKVDLDNLEKIFILACLAHHDGNDDDANLSNLLNKRIFRGRWTEIDSFDLDTFDINGFGRTYYSRQLEVLRSAWSVLGTLETSKINEVLASSIQGIELTSLAPTKFDKPSLLALRNLCLCNTKENTEEREAIAKLVFGFFDKKTGLWQINDDEYSRFLKGEIELDFQGSVPNEAKNLEDLVFLDNPEEVQEWNLRRRNSLFLFLKIVAKTEPQLDEFRRYIWDALYFGQSRRDSTSLNFGKLEQVRKYWEYFQLNVYYVYAIEMLLDAIQQLVNQNYGIKKSELLSALSMTNLLKSLSTAASENITSETRLSEITQYIEKRNSGALRTGLNSPINESAIFDMINTSTNIEDQIAGIVVMLSLLTKRYLSTEETIRNFGRLKDGNLAASSENLSIHRIIREIVEHGADIQFRKYIEVLMERVINQHIIESVSRLSSTGTRNWIFTEEDGRLYFSRRSFVDFDARDNRWNSIRSLLRDIGFVTEQGGRLLLTEEGATWLSKTE
jgi:hypothetical protein